METVFLSEVAATKTRRVEIIFQINSFLSWRQNKKVFYAPGDLWLHETFFSPKNRMRVGKFNHNPWPHALLRQQQTANIVHWVLIKIIDFRLNSNRTWLSKQTQNFIHVYLQISFISTQKVSIDWSDFNSVCVTNAEQFLTTTFFIDVAEAKTSEKVVKLSCILRILTWKQRFN